MNVSETIRRTLQNRRPSRVDWTTSPYLEVYRAGLKARGDFGEELVVDWYTNQGILPSERINLGHDVLGGTEKAEVKTSFRGKNGSYFFNQIYYENSETGCRKDWDFLFFVFVAPAGIEMWKCTRPEIPAAHFRLNNSWSWKKGSSDWLDKSIWTKVWSEGSLT